MSATSTIEWTEKTWNPSTGCDRISAGCDNCYALTLAKRLKAMGSAKYQADGDPRTSGPGFGVAVHDDALGEPLRWRNPTVVFVNSMSDLFHARVPDAFIVGVFSVMARTPRHTYQLLTKRHGRMRSLLSTDGFRDAVLALAPGALWPLRNLWLGVSVEDQQSATLRIPALLDTPAWIRWLSCEPLLGPIDLDAADHDARCDGGIDWVVAGGESGPGARPMHPDWARGLRDQCTDSGIPFFFKQWGEWVAAPSNYGPDVPQRARPSTELVFSRASDVDGQIMLRRGKKAAGRELDGRTFDEFPPAPRGIPAPEAVTR